MYVGFVCEQLLDVYRRSEDALQDRGRGARLCDAGRRARVTGGTAANGRLEATVIKVTPVQASATDGNTVSRA
jgi:hypothetical protein